MVLDITDWDTVSVFMALVLLDILAQPLLSLPGVPKESAKGLLMPNLTIMVLDITDMVSVFMDLVLLDILVQPLLSLPGVPRESAKGLLMPNLTTVITVMEVMASAMDTVSDTAVDMLTIIMARGRLMLNLITDTEV